MKWTRKRPTKADDGKWFFVKFKEPGQPARVRFKSVRVDGDGQIYLCPESDLGVGVKTYGNLITNYSENFTEYCGPIEIPEYEE